MQLFYAWRYALKANGVAAGDAALPHVLSAQCKNI